MEGGRSSVDPGRETTLQPQNLFETTAFFYCSFFMLLIILISVIMLLIIIVIVVLMSLFALLSESQGVLNKTSTTFTFLIQCACLIVFVLFCFSVVVFVPPKNTAQLTVEMPISTSSSSVT